MADHISIDFDRVAQTATAVAQAATAIRQILELVRHLENEVRRLSKLDREYARVESWIIMNTEFDGNSKATDCGDRLIRHLQGLKRRAEAAGRRSLS